MKKAKHNSKKCMDGSCMLKSCFEDI